MLFNEDSACWVAPVAPTYIEMLNEVNTYSTGQTFFFFFFIALQLMVIHGVIFSTAIENHYICVPLISLFIFPCTLSVTLTQGS